MTHAAALSQAMSPEVVELCKKLRDNGERGWVVGGSVRDVILADLGQTPAKPYDWDVATTAKPERVQQLFRRVIPTGIAHGTVTVMMGKLGIEVTTLRGETTYSDGRHPDSVTYVDDIRADVSRRDFTVNAIAFDPLEGTIEDPFGGLADLKNRTLRAVRDPNLRFAEDGLRVLRAARFAATLEFELEPNTRRAIRPSLDSYGKVSAERIRDEWLKALRARKPSIAFNIMLEEGMLERTAKELCALAGCEQNRYHAYDVWEHTLRVLDGVPREHSTLRMAALLHDLGKPSTRAKNPTTEDYTFYQHEVVGAKIAGDLLTRLKFPNSERQTIVHLVRHHLVVYEPSWTDAAVRRFVTRVGLDHFRDIITLAHADVLGKGRDVSTETARLLELTSRIDCAIEKGSAFGLGDLALTGGDLMESLGVSPGPLVGKLLRELLEHVLEYPEHNQRERLLAEARELLENGQVRLK